MKNILFLIGLILIFSCKKKPQNSISKKDSAITAIDSPAVNIDSSTIGNLKQNEMQYKEPKDGFYSKDYIDGDVKAKVYYQRKDGNVSYYKIAIYKNDKKIQTINEKSESTFYDEDYINLTFEDANFDGKKDFLITKFIGMNFDKQYLYLYNNGIFVKKKHFDEITSPFVDSKNKEIVSQYRVGPHENHTEIYKWKNGKLIQTYSNIEGDNY